MWSTCGRSSLFMGVRLRSSSFISVHGRACPLVGCTFIGGRSCSVWWCGWILVAVRDVVVGGVVVTVRRGASLSFVVEWLPHRQQQHGSCFFCVNGRGEGVGCSLPHCCPSLAILECPRLSVFGCHVANSDVALVSHVKEGGGGTSVLTSTLPIVLRLLSLPSIRYW